MMPQATLRFGWAFPPKVALVVEFWRWNRASILSPFGLPRLIRREIQSPVSGRWSC